MMNPSVSILGSGWLGLPLARHLQQQQYPIRLSSRNAQKCAQLSQQGFEMHQIDISQLDDQINAFLQSDILIINITHKSLTDFNQLKHHLLQSPIKSVLFISSSSVYQNLNRMVSEDEAVEDPDSPLYQIEQLFQTTPEFETSVLRLSGLIGPERHPGRFFHNKPVKQPDIPVNLIHRIDCIGLIEAILTQHAWGEIFNGCADSHPTKREFYTHASQQLGRAIPAFEDTNEKSYKIVSNEKVKQQLAYFFLHPDLMQLQPDDYE